MTPDEIYALDDLEEKRWYEFKEKKLIPWRGLYYGCFPALFAPYASHYKDYENEISPINFDRAEADGANDFSLCLKICTPVQKTENSVCWTLLFDRRPFGFLTACMYFNNRSSGASLDISNSLRTYITDLTLWQAAEDLVRSYIDVPVLDKSSFDMPVLANNKAFPGLASIEGMALAVSSLHRTLDGIVVFNASIYYRLLNELIESEGEEKLNQMDWHDDSPIVEEMARIVLLSVPKGIEARVRFGTGEKSWGRRRVLAILRLDNGTYGLSIKEGGCLLDYKDSRSIMLSYLGTPDVFGSAHERIKWIEEDPRRV